MRKIDNLDKKMNDLGQGVINLLAETGLGSNDLVKVALDLKLTEVDVYLKHESSLDYKAEDLVKDIVKGPVSCILREKMDAFCKSLEYLCDKYEMPYSEMFCLATQIATLNISMIEDMSDEDIDNLKEESEEEDNEAQDLYGINDLFE